MRVDVDMTAGSTPPGAVEATSRRLRFVLARFGRDVLAVNMHAQPSGPGRLRLAVEVILADDERLHLAAEDDASESALDHFIDRVGRAVARRLHPLDRKHRDG